MLDAKTAPRVGAIVKEDTMSKTVWVLIGIGIGLLIMLVLGSLLPLGSGSSYGWGMMGPGMMGGFGFPFMFMGGIVMILFWGLIIGGGVWLIQTLTRSTGQTGMSALANESPLDILKRRYAKGEITQEQFAQMKRDLDT
jgi:putative membrane protein